MRQFPCVRHVPYFVGAAVFGTFYKVLSELTECSWILRVETFYNFKIQEGLIVT
jgi:hypothetical protein